MMGRQQDDQAKLFYEFSRRPNSTGLLPKLIGIWEAVIVR